MSGARLNGQAASTKSINTKKMIQEASLAEQIETQGYHLREAQTTFDFTKKLSNNSDDMTSRNSSRT